MDFHAAMETFAEAWVAANTQTAVNTDSQAMKQTSLEDLPTQLPKEQLVPAKPPDKPHGPRPPNNQQPSASGTGTKSLPIHCIIEQTTGAPSFDHDGSAHGSVELDSYAILPGTTLFLEIVRAALIKLGYSSTEAMSAKGAIQIKHWKPLTFDAITEDTQATVEEVLGELSQVATLRIKICSQSKLSSTDEVKEKLLQLLLTQSQGLLINSGCPIEKDFLSSISTGDSILGNITPEMRREFDKWYTEQLLKSQKSMSEDKSSSDSSPEKSENNSASSDPSINPMLSSPLGHGKTRLRTSFDPEHEIPRLQKWFQDNQHPTREQMMHYLSELNRLESRKGRRPLDLTNIIYWFKNARAAHRRASKSLDDGYDMEDGVESSPIGLDHVPFLPNKNAVYIVPYPLHSAYMHHTPHHNNLEDLKEPCDLSQNRKYTPSPQKAEITTANENIQNGNHENEMQREIAKDKDVENAPVIKTEEPVSSIKCEVMEEVQDLRTVPSMPKEDNDCGSHSDSNIDHKELTNGIQESDNELEDDDCDSYTEDELSNDDSLSSHNDHDPNIKKEVDDQDYMNSHMPPHMGGINTSSHQPLHIPQFPHPLAMHYFPLNTHMFSQQTPPRSFHQYPPKSGQENTHRKRRTRVFIDPLSEIPKLEKWFIEDTHPSAYMIDKYCEELNSSEYRQKFPRLESKNVQLWFKNHRAKVKRMRLATS